MILSLRTSYKFASAKTQRLQNPEMEMIWENKKTWQQEELEDVITPQDYQRDEHLLPLSLWATIKARDIIIPASCTTWNVCQLTTQANKFLIRHFLRHRGKLDKYFTISKTGLFKRLIPKTFITRIKNKLLPKLEMLKIEIRTKSQLLMGVFGYGN